MLFAACRQSSFFAWGICFAEAAALPDSVVLLGAVSLPGAVALFWPAVILRAVALLEAADTGSTGFSFVVSAVLSALFSIIILCTAVPSIPMSGESGSDWERILSNRVRPGFPQWQD